MHAECLSSTSRDPVRSRGHSLPTLHPSRSRSRSHRIPPRCHENIINIVSTCELNLSMVMPAAVCDLRGLVDDKTVLSSMSLAERMT